jgi:uncharacterized membrane protein YiaA
MFIYSIIIIKIIYLFLIAINYYYAYDVKKHPFDMDSLKKQITTEKIKKILEKIFILSIALLLIILFYPNNINNLMIDHETKQILCLFGVVIFIKELGFIF